MKALNGPVMFLNVFMSILNLSLGNYGLSAINAVAALLLAISMRLNHDNT